MNKTEIEKLARKHGEISVDWNDVKSIFIGNEPDKQAYTWANNNMMWVEFHYNENKDEIIKATFGSSK